ncbi:hypothetical protein RFI_31379 [Reticulomyxa filosa]|uniref:CBS domain-containing protein n=1 Tax=Reticulomyxa filosa TaxID=46433 RepID=X6LWN0_RETFI|nr:hypothetical protein RFI_31379 [Reticulomyxa filosa]|eukprot:ETO06019.1 hypothetical protein RFI_31379 [Reticulomyxa filosa]
MDFLQTIAPDVYVEQIPAKLRDAHMPNQNKGPPVSENKLESRLKALDWKLKSRQLFSRQKINAPVHSPERTEIDADKKNAFENKNNVLTNSPSKEIRRRHCSLMAGGFLERLHLAPFQVIAEMPLSKIYTLFHILKPENVYVTKYSRLIGVITELHLLELEKQFQTNKSAQPLCAPNFHCPYRR